jgi:hypothetical protein
MKELTLRVAPDGVWREPYHLSPEDVYWIEAISRRAELTRGWSRPQAYAEAKKVVEGFYEEQIATYGWIEREIEAQLKIKRLDYEAATDKYVKEQEEHRELQRIWAEKAEARRKKQQPLEKEFKAAGGMRRWAYIEHHKGKTNAELARQLGMTRSGIGNMLNTQARIERGNYYRWPILHPTQSRVIDMGGPRDVWLTFFPSPDPRVDDIELVLPGKSRAEDKVEV